MSVSLSIGLSYCLKSSFLSYLHGLLPYFLYVSVHKHPLREACPDHSLLGICALYPLFFLTILLRIEWTLLNLFIVCFPHCNIHSKKACPSFSYFLILHSHNGSWYMVSTRATAAAERNFVECSLYLECPPLTHQPHKVLLTHHVSALRALLLYSPP